MSITYDATGLLAAWDDNPGDLDHCADCGRIVLINGDSAEDTAADDDGVVCAHCCADRHRRRWARRAASAAGTAACGAGLGLLLGRGL